MSAQLLHAGACAYCGDTGGPFEWDHVIAVSAGGLDHPVNLITACRPCNRDKGDALCPSWWRDNLPQAVRDLERRLLNDLERRIAATIPKVSFPLPGGAK